jgi:hypothetical protein
MVVFNIAIVTSKLLYGSNSREASRILSIVELFLTTEGTLSGKIFISYRRDDAVVKVVGKNEIGTLTASPKVFLDLRENLDADDSTHKKPLTLEKPTSCLGKARGAEL